MKIIVMGTGPFAVPTFQWLLNSAHTIGLLVTRPIEDAGRRRKSLANPMRCLAESQSDVEIFDPPRINDPAAVQRIAAVAADLLVVCDYGQILSPEALATARLGGINLHGSLLPAYRARRRLTGPFTTGKPKPG